MVALVHDWAFSAYTDFQPILSIFPRALLRRGPRSFLLWHTTNKPGGSNFPLSLRIPTWDWEGGSSGPYSPVLSSIYPFPPTLPLLQPWKRWLWDDKSSLIHLKVFQGSCLHLEPSLFPSGPRLGTQA